MNKYFLLLTVPFLAFCSVGFSSLHAMDVEPDETDERGSKIKSIADTSSSAPAWFIPKEQKVKKQIMILYFMVISISLLLL